MPETQPLSYYKAFHRAQRQFTSIYVIFGDKRTSKTWGYNFDHSKGAYTTYTIGTYREANDARTKHIHEIARYLIDEDTKLHHEQLETTV